MTAWIGTDEAGEAWPAAEGQSMMRGRRTRLVSILAAVGLLLVFGFFIWSVTAPGEFDRITVGVSRNEVESILGPPSEVVRYVSGDFPSIHIWKKPDWTIIVGYDAGGNVSSRDVQSRGLFASAWRKIRNTLGF